MEMITVADALKLAPLTLGQVAGGASGLSNVIDSVSVLEVNLLKIPGGRAFANGKALDISSMYCVMDSVEEQIAMIRLLKKRGNSGLVLCHVGIVIHDVASELIAICDALAFPLIVMPPNVGYREIIVAVSDALLGLENQKLNYTVALQDSITALLVKDQSVKGLIDNLSRLIDCHTAYFNYNLKAEHTQSFSEAYLSYIREQIRKHTLAFMDSYTETLVPGFEDGPPILLVPLYRNISYFGVIVIVKAREFTELDQIAVLQTKNALSIATLNQTDIFEQRTRLLTDYIDDLIHGYCENEQVIIHRGATLNHNITLTRAVVVADIFEFEKLIRGTDEANVQELKKAFADHMESLLHSFSPASAGCKISDKFVILFSERLPRDKLRQRLQYFGEKIQASVEADLRLKVALGVGSFCDQISQVKDSYEQALGAIHISNSIYRAPRIAFSEDLPAYSFLLRLARGHERALEAIEADMLRPLYECDQSTGSSLEQTYRMLLKCDMDTNLVAQRLFVHKNTVLQRKKKILELYPCDPFAVTERLQFQMICLLNDLLRSDRNEDCGSIS